MVAWMPSAVRPVNRLSADERREAVLDAAVHEFAQAGYHAASTTSIARGAGISQPYIYALFPNKKALFIGCQERVAERIQESFEKAARGVDDPEERAMRMGESYKRLLDDRDHLLCQLQGFAAAGDPEIREPVAACFKETFDRIAELLGTTPEEARAFVATGMYLNITRALELPKEYTGED
jgi:AcrR family transcriptional regulator